jgi:hypothetical protein
VRDDAEETFRGLQPHPNTHHVRDLLEPTSKKILQHGVKVKEVINNI